MNYNTKNDLKRFLDNIGCILNKYIKSQNKSSLFMGKMFLPVDNKSISAHDNYFNGKIGTINSAFSNSDLTCPDISFNILFQMLQQIDPDSDFHVVHSSTNFPKFAVLMGCVAGSYNDEFQGKPFAFFGKGYAEKSVSDLVKIEAKLFNIVEYGTTLKFLNDKPFQNVKEAMNYEDGFVKVIEEEINKK